MTSEKPDVTDTEFFVIMKVTIEKNLSELKKVVNNISQMRVEAAYLESDLISTIDASTWVDVSELLGMASISTVQVSVKKETETQERDRK